MFALKATPLYGKKNTQKKLLFSCTDCGIHAPIAQSAWQKQFFLHSGIHEPITYHLWPETYDLRPMTYDLSPIAQRCVNTIGQFCVRLRWRQHLYTKNERARTNKTKQNRTAQKIKQNKSKENKTISKEFDIQSSEQSRTKYLLWQAAPNSKCINK